MRTVSFNNHAWRLLAILVAMLLGFKHAGANSLTNKNEVFTYDTTDNDIQLNQTKPSEYLNRAKDCIAEGKYDEAIVICNRLILQLNYPFAYYLRGHAYFMKKDYDKAIVDMSEYGRMYTNFDIYFLRGCAYMAKGDSMNAIEDFNKSSAFDSNNAATFYNRGHCFLKLSKLDMAIADFTQALQIGPPNTVTYEERAMAYYLENDVDNAIADCTESIELNTNNTAAYYIRAQAYGGKNDFGKCIADFAEIIRINPHEASAYASRGLFYSYEGEYKTGISDCYKGVQLDTNCTVAFNNLAWLLATAPDASLRNGQEALAYANRACTLSAWKEPYTLGTLAAANAETGNFKDAVAWEEKSIKLGLLGKELKQAQARLDLYKQNKPYHAEPPKAKNP